MIWSLKGVNTILYRLPEIASIPWAIICEGEKSADTLAALNLPSTTAPMGAGKWRDSYSDFLAGKDVAIAPDNDEPGIEHANIIAQSLHGKAKSIRILAPLSSRPKGGIDDWLTESTPHKSAQDVINAISSAPEWIPSTLSLASSESTTCNSANSNDPTQSMLDAAKSANIQPYRNYIPVETEVIKKGKPSTEITKEPRMHNSMLDDLSRRFLSFPRRVGENWLFDHDRDSAKIIHITDSDDLISWISRRSKKNADFGRGDAMITPR